jgi:hypothetical protein
MIELQQALSTFLELSYHSLKLSRTYLLIWRSQAKAYLKQDGERILNIKSLTARARKYIPRIRADLELLEDVLDTYERDKTR